MSHSISKFSAHGFCEAIFSTSPLDYNKENKTPIKKVGKISCPDVFNEPIPVSKKQSETKFNSTNTQYTNHRQYAKSLHQMEPVAKCSATNLRRSKSVNMLHKSDPIISGNLIFDDRQKTPIKVGCSSRASGEKTPVMQLHTPKQMKLGNNVKVNTISATKTPIKRYFSDHALSQATPECFNVVQVETPSAKANIEAIEEQTLYEGENSNLTVGVRVRPLNSKELTEAKISRILHLNGQNITVDCELAQHTFTYDHCFISYTDPSTPGHASQETVFKNMVLPLVQTAFEGYNVCLFAYGQTGSGKSYSMMGKESSEVSTVIDPEAGIIPRFCQEIFTKVANTQRTTTKVEISYFEIYNEKIHDLLTNVSNGVKRPPLKVREHPAFGPYIVDLSQHSVNTYKDLQTWLKVGKSQRATAATGMNEKSSRSHSIFSIILTQTPVDGQRDCKSIDASRRSKINLVDLAGSERLSQTCASGDRLREGVSINKSLLTLGKVIASLAENMNNRKRGFVPYRESVLTWLLKESLGGNSRTVMLGTVSPANIHIEETLATLRYACQARAIVNRIRINEDPHDRLIRELKEEVLRLRSVHEGYERQLGVVPRRLLDSIEPIPSTHNDMREKQNEIDRLKEQLKKTEEQLAITQMTWQEKLQEADKRKNFELRYLRRCGIAVELDLRERQKQPCLINLAADPMLSGTLLYLIPPGLVRIGKNSEVNNSKCTKKRLDIVLDGPLVRQLHCTIEHKNGKLTLSPEMDGDTYVNGEIVIEKVHLKHGDRLVIGGNHYFKISNPHDEGGTVSTQVVDYEFAHKEILKIQEEKLRAELEESKQKAIKELENAKKEVELQLGSQRTTYEHKIEVLGSTLEEQKLALEEINTRKKELELEKEVLANEVETNNRIRRIQQEEIKVNVSPYESNFLQELEGILNEQTADAETALKMRISEDAIIAGGITLHEMQLLVREATERCREVGLNYEFHQQRIVVDKSLQPVIRVRDRDRMIETLWQPLPFLDWVHRLRDHDIEDSIKELRDTDTSWDAYEDSEVFEESMNSSRISVNMSPVKKHLNESLHQFSMDASILEGTVADQTSASITSELNENINACLIQMELATKTLAKLCHRYDREDIRSNITKSLNKVQSVMDDLRSMLETRDLRENNDKSPNLSQSLEVTVIEKSDNEMIILSDQDSNKTCKNIVISSCKSNLRNNNLHVKGGNASKTVRFTDAIKQGNTEK